MKLLFVASRPPYPPLKGDSLRAFHHLRLLSRRHEVTLLVPAYREPPPPDLVVMSRLARRVEVVLLQRASWEWFFWVLKGLPRLPLQVLWFHHPRITAVVRELVARERFDLVHVQTARIGAAGLGLAVPAALDLVDALSLNLESRRPWAGPLASWVFGREAQRMRAWERFLVARYSAGFVSSPVDRDAIGDFPHLLVLGNGVETVSERLAPRAPSLDIVFHGHMGYFPNVDAAVWFARDILPLVRQRVPQARLRILGAAPSRRVRRLAALPGVEVTGYVPELYPELLRAAVMVCPLRCGTGIPNKVLEALAAGLPVVATPLALQGLAPLVHASAVAVAASAEETADRVSGLLENPQKARELGEHGARVVAAHYRWEDVVKQMEARFRRCAAAPEES